MSAKDEMYEKYSVTKKRQCDWICADSELCNANCKYYGDTTEYYPPFTVEKQLELIKKILDFKINIILTSMDGVFSIFSYVFATAEDKAFEIALAKFVTTAHKFLTQPQRQEVKEILER